VLDVSHAAPAGGADRQHHDDPGRQELDVRASGEAGDVRDALEERTEQKEPDHGLDERDPDPRRLPEDGSKMAQGDLPGMTERLHAASSMSRQLRPACRRATSSRDGRPTVTADD